MVLGHADWVVGAEAIRGASQEIPGEEVRRGYARCWVRALVHSYGSGDVVVEALFIPEERGSAEYEPFQKGSVEG